MINVHSAVSECGMWHARPDTKSWTKRCEVWCPRQMAKADVGLMRHGWQPRGRDPPSKVAHPIQLQTRDGRKGMLNR